MMNLEKQPSLLKWLGIMRSLHSVAKISFNSQMTKESYLNVNENEVMNSKYYRFLVCCSSWYHLNVAIVIAATTVNVTIL